MTSVGHLAAQHLSARAPGGCLSWSGQAAGGTRAQEMAFGSGQEEPWAAPPVTLEQMPVPLRGSDSLFIQIPGRCVQERDFYIHQLLNFCAFRVFINFKDPWSPTSHHRKERGATKEGN